MAKEVDGELGALVPFLLGRMTFNRRRRIVREREIATREAVAAERAAIARELHDVVAHHMSVMVVQAGAARAVSASDPAAAAEALRHIEASGRTGGGQKGRVGRQPSSATWSTRPNARTASGCASRAATSSPMKGAGYESSCAIQTAYFPRASRSSRL